MMIQGFGTFHSKIQMPRSLNMFAWMLFQQKSLMASLFPDNVGKKESLTFINCPLQMIVIFLNRKIASKSNKIAFNLVLLVAFSGN